MTKEELITFEEELKTAVEGVMRRHPTVTHLTLGNALSEVADNMAMELQRKEELARMGEILAEMRGKEEGITAR